MLQLTKALFAGRLALCVFVGAVSTVAGPEPSAQTRTAQETTRERDGNRLLLIEKYKKRALRSVSPSGRFLALWNVVNPVTVYRIPLLSGGPRTRSPARGNSLSVVERSSGRELDRIPVSGLSEALFLGSETSVLYRARERDEGSHRVRSIWTIGKTKSEQICPDQPLWHGFGSLRVLEGDLVVGHSSLRVNWATVIKGSIADCSILMMDTPDPNSPKREGGILDFSVAQDERSFAYIFSTWDGTRRTVDIWVRNVSDFKVRTHIEHQVGWRYHHLALSPDGALLVVDAYLRGDPPKNPEAQHRAFIYDVESGRVIRIVDADAREGVTVSPNGKYLAVGTTETKMIKERIRSGRARVLLFDLQTGIRIGWGEYPGVKLGRRLGRRRDPWLANINALVFTPDSNPHFQFNV